MYFEYSSKKISLTIIALALLSAGVYITFFIKNARFGDMRLSYAFSRFTESKWLLLKYSFQYALSGNANPFAALVGSLSVNSKAPQSIAAGPRAQAIPVLTYHAIVKDPDGHNVTRNTFVSHMFALKEAGWETISLKEYRAFMRRELELPQRSFMLTFDDGAKDSYYPVDPVLQALSYNAVSFVISGHSAGGGTFYYLSAPEIKTMLRSGRWEIGSHSHALHDVVPIDEAGTLGPPLVNRIWSAEHNRLETPEEFESRIREDFRLAKENLEQTFRIPITSYAFPFGEYGQGSLASIQNEESLNAIYASAQAFHEMALYQWRRGDGFQYNYPSGTSKDKSFSLIKRIEPSSALSADDLVKTLEAGMPKSLPYHDSFDDDKGWFSTWGDNRIEHGTLIMKTSPNETGGAIILDGTGAWKDYRINATVESPPQTGIVLWARFSDNGNYAACNFGNDFTHIEEELAESGGRRVIRGIRGPQNFIPEGAFTLSMEVRGRRVSCFRDGAPLVSVTTDFLDPSLAQGGIGLKIWDREPNKSMLIVHNIEVDELNAVANN